MLNPSMLSGGKKGYYLSQEEAINRRRLISGYVRYKIFLRCINGPTYDGYTEMSFNLVKIETKPLHIDYKGKGITQVMINQAPMLPEVLAHNYDGYILTLPGEMLKIGENQVRINFEGDYVNNVQGFQRSIEWDDCYVFTNSEPDYARR